MITRFDTIPESDRHPARHPDMIARAALCSLARCSRAAKMRKVSYSCRQCQVKPLIQHHDDINPLDSKDNCRRAPRWSSVLKSSLSILVAMYPTYVLVFSCTPMYACYYLPLSVAYTRNCCLLVKWNCIFWTCVSMIKSRFVYVLVTGMICVVHQ